MKFVIPTMDVNIEKLGNDDYFFNILDSVAE